MKKKIPHNSRIWHGTIRNMERLVCLQRCVSLLRIRLTETRPRATEVRHRTWWE